MSHCGQCGTDTAVEYDDRFECPQGHVVAIRETLIGGRDCGRYIAETVMAAPPLTAAQRHVIATILRPATR